MRLKSEECGEVEGDEVSWSRREEAIPAVGLCSLDWRPELFAEVAILTHGASPLWPNSSSSFYSWHTSSLVNLTLHRTIPLVVIPLQLGHYLESICAPLISPWYWQGHSGRKNIYLGHLMRILCSFICVRSVFCVLRNYNSFMGMNSALSY